MQTGHVPESADGADMSRAQAPASHFEQQRRVRHRLARHRAGRCMNYASTDADAIAEVLADVLARPIDYRPVPADGAQRAAALIAEDL
jgi:hypothetical protein